MCVCSRCRALQHRSIASPRSVLPILITIGLLTVLDSSVVWRAVAKRPARFMHKVFAKADTAPAQSAATAASNSDAHYFSVSRSEIWPEVALDECSVGLGALAFTCEDEFSAVRAESVKALNHIAHHSKDRNIQRHIATIIVEMCHDQDSDVKLQVLKTVTDPLGSFITQT